MHTQRQWFQLWLAQNGVAVASLSLTKILFFSAGASLVQRAACLPVQQPRVLAGIQWSHVVRTLENLDKAIVRWGLISQGGQSLSSDLARMEEEPLVGLAALGLSLYARSSLLEGEVPPLLPPAVHKSPAG